MSTMSTNVDFDTVAAADQAANVAEVVGAYARDLRHPARRRRAALDIRRRLGTMRDLLERVIAGCELAEGLWSRDEPCASLTPREFCSSVHSDPAGWDVDDEVTEVAVPPITESA